MGQPRAGREVSIPLLGAGSEEGCARPAAFVRRLCAPRFTRPGFYLAAGQGGRKRGAAGGNKRAGVGGEVAGNGGSHCERGQGRGRRGRPDGAMAQRCAVPARPPSSHTPRGSPGLGHRGHGWGCRGGWIKLEGVQLAPAPGLAFGLSPSAPSWTIPGDNGDDHRPRPLQTPPSLILFAQSPPSPRRRPLVLPLRRRGGSHLVFHPAEETLTGTEPASWCPARCAKRQRGPGCPSGIGLGFWGDTRMGLPGAAASLSSPVVIVPPPAAVVPPQHQLLPQHLP